MNRLLMLLLVLLVVAGCGGTPALADQVTGTWESEGVTLMLDVGAGSYMAMVGSQEIARDLRVVSATGRTVRMELDGNRELIVTFAADSWDQATIEQPNSWTFEFTRTD
jgi:hypothetical protein